MNFEKLKAKGYQVTEWQEDHIDAKQVMVRKGDIEVCHQINSRDYNNPKLLIHLEEHIERQFESEVKKRIDTMALNYGLQDRYGPQHISEDQYMKYIKNCHLIGERPDPMIRHMYSENPKPTGQRQSIVPGFEEPKLKPKPTNKILLIINKRK